MGKFYATVERECVLYARQLAWLNTAPEVEHKGRGKAAEPVTRLKAMEARGETPRLPLVSARHVAEWWLEIGPTSGEHAVTWQDMAAWERLTGIELEPWEAKAIRSMSVAFRSEQITSRKPNSPQPWDEGDRQDKVDAAFGAMMKALSHRTNAGK